MGQRIIDVWTRQQTSKEFEWGQNDCHQLLYQFMRLTNLEWEDPDNIGDLAGTYSTRHEAMEVAKTLEIPKWFEQLGYSAKRVNRIETGDVVWVPLKKSHYDMYWPVVSNKTVLVGDPTTNSIILRHIDELSHYDYQVYRRD
tara:strand:+ start:3202 stop:3627 length:426 start_codon:yes stop_codon:yes gene_type:complete